MHYASYLNRKEYLFIIYYNNTTHNNIPLISIDASLAYNGAGTVNVNNTKNFPNNLLLIKIYAIATFKLLQIKKMININGIYCC